MQSSHLHCYVGSLHLALNLSQFERFLMKIGIMCFQYTIFVGFCIYFFNLNPRQSFKVLELVQFGKLILYNPCLWHGNSQNMSGRF